MEEALDDIYQAELAYPHLYARLPPTSTGISDFEKLAPYYFDWLEHDTWDEYWQGFSIHPRHGQITVPTLQVGGWYDVFLEGSLQNYEGLRQRAATPEAREGQRLIVGPWYHMPWGSSVGGYDFGEEGGNIVNQAMLRWYEYHLKGEPNGLDQEAPVKLFVMGENRWREEDAWPLARAVDTSFFLHSGGAANSRHGDGTLSKQPPADEPYDLYMHRGDNYVQSLGGHSCCTEDVAPQGAYDQRKVEDRNDVLCYTSEVLREDLEVTGWVSCRLFAAADAVDADWCAKLVDVHADGTALNITQGVIRARYRDSLERTSPIEPGRVYEYTINLRATSNVFKAGHRIRLEIASSNFPMYDRNPGNGARSKDVQASDFRPVTHRVFHDGGRASHVVLPVVPRG
jgi:putative CocE/NonD family hydrolase